MLNKFLVQPMSVMPSGRLKFLATGGIAQTSEREGTSKDDSDDGGTSAYEKEARRVHSAGRGMFF